MASYIITEAATAALRLSAFPGIGIFKNTSHIFYVSSESPLASFPITNALGFLKLQSYRVLSPLR